MQKTILLLASNPIDTAPLRLDREARDIRNGLERSRHRDRFTLVERWAVRPKDVRRAMLELRPNIVHFCGHGTDADGISLQDDSGHSTAVGPGALAELFELFSDHVECVVLNACYSEPQAAAISSHVRYVIGIPAAIEDRTAIDFAVAFYDGLGAGESVGFAYELARTAARMAGAPKNLTPVLLRNRRVLRKLRFKQIGKIAAALGLTASAVVLALVLAMGIRQSLELKPEAEVEPPAPGVTQERKPVPEVHAGDLSAHFTIADRKNDACNTYGLTGEGHGYRAGVRFKVEALGRFHMREVLSFKAELRDPSNRFTASTPFRPEFIDTHIKDYWRAGDDGEVCLPFPAASDVAVVVFRQD